MLASQSPRRRALLEQAGISFTVRIAGIDESVEDGESPSQYVRRLASEKALAVPKAPEECILAADTTVVVDNRILGKPEDAADAAAMLRLLSGRSHEVITGICLRYQSDLIVDAAHTIVHFSEMTDREIDGYVATGEPMDKAGAYGIQGIASRYVRGIEGCFFNVVGLPVPLVSRYLSGLKLI